MAENKKGLEALAEGWTSRGDTHPLSIRSWELRATVIPLGYTLCVCVCVL